MKAAAVGDSRMGSADGESLVMSDEGQPPPGTLQFIYEHIKDAPERQAQVWRDLDGKLFQTFTLASVVLGLGGVAAASRHSWVGSGLLIVALIAYVVAVVAVLLHWVPQTFKGSTFGETLWPDFWDRPPDEIRHGIVQEITEEIYPQNNKVLAGKAQAIKVALGATAAEVVLVIVAVIVDRL